LLIAQQGQQVFLLKCELASQLSIRIGSLDARSTQYGQ